MVADCAKDADVANSAIIPLPLTYDAVYAKSATSAYRLYDPVRIVTVTGGMMFTLYESS